MLKDTDDLSWYARKAARALTPGEREPDLALTGRVEALFGELRAGGVKGDGSSMTLFTRGLPAGCRSCLKGRGTNLYVTGLCTRDCFFCFNHKPRKDELVVHGIPVKSAAEAAEVVERFQLHSVGISGGEPLLFPDRVVELLRALRALGRPLRIELYTNGDRAVPALLRRLKGAGLDSLRINMAARDYDLSPLRRALDIFSDLAVEIPAVPSQLARQKKLILELEALGVPYLNLHELFVSPENAARMTAEGYAAVDADHQHLIWKPVPESGEAALKLLLFALRHTRRLSAYYCSCGTQETISRRGLARRASATAAASA